MPGIGVTEELRIRTKRFAIHVIRFSETLPQTSASRVIERQMIRSSTSLAANYRAACRARSRAEFIAKLGTVVEEADETLFWLDLLSETGIASQKTLHPLFREANELLAIFSASRRTAKSKDQKNRNHQITRSPDSV